jgi:hypothetical protein
MTAQFKTGRSSSLQYLHCTSSGSLLLYVPHVLTSTHHKMLEQIRLKEENRTILINSMRMPIILSLLMDVPRIVMVPILCRTRLVYTFAIPERREETSHILKLPCARTIHTLITFRDKVHNLTLLKNPITNRPRQVQHSSHVLLHSRHWVDVLRSLFTELVHQTKLPYPR